MTSGNMALRRLLEELEELLAGFGEHWWAGRLLGFRETIDVNPDRARRELQTAFGGMGSLTDLQLSRFNGHVILESEEIDANEKLRSLVAEIWSELTSVS